MTSKRENMGYTALEVIKRAEDEILGALSDLDEGLREHGLCTADVDTSTVYDEILGSEDYPIHSVAIKVRPR